MNCFDELDADESDFKVVVWGAVTGFTSPRSDPWRVLVNTASDVQVP
jgi:hypothetical protein